MATLKKQEGSISDSIADLQEQLAEKEKQHEAEVDYLLKIKPGCDFITENIDVRNEHREAELKSLESAVTTLKDTPAYKKAAAAAEKEEELKSLESAVTTRKDTPAYKKAAAAAE